MDDQLVAAHGGRLIDLRAGPDRAAGLRASSRDWPSWDLDVGQLCDLELLISGALSPLTGFLGRADYESVADSWRLRSGVPWPVPIVLDVSEELAESLSAGASVALRDQEGTMIAALHVTDIWRREVDGAHGAVSNRPHPTPSHEHPTPGDLIGRIRPWLVGGRVEGVAAPTHYDFRALRMTPAEVRAEFVRLGWSQVAAYQPRGFMHRAEVEATREACRRHGTNLLIQASTCAAEGDHYTRLRAYQAVVREYPPATALLSVLPLARRSAGPREQWLEAIVAKNHGCGRLLVSSEEAGPAQPSDAAPDGPAGPAGATPPWFRHEVGVEVDRMPRRVHVAGRQGFVAADEPAASDEGDTDLGAILARGGTVPDWFSYPDVVAELRKQHPPRDRQGFTVFFTGLSGSGKSTVANVLVARLLERGGRPVTLLDGDVVRKHLSSELGFSKEHRDINIRRIGYVASEITKNGGIAICAPIAPYQAVRDEVRAMIAPLGGFVLVAVATSLEVCEARDRKGLYAKARAGILTEFTGISDPYEVPTDAEIVIDTARLSAGEAADEIIGYLEREGFIQPEHPEDGTTARR